MCWFKAQSDGTVTVNFFNQTSAAAPGASPRRNGESGLRLEGYQSRYATNMTMICKVEGEGLRAYQGEQLVGVATKIDSLYFLTISSERTDELRFETEDGTVLQPLTVNNEPLTIGYQADSHHGSLKAPIILKQGDNRPYKVIENQHVIIIRNNEKYDVTGKKL